MTSWKLIVVVMLVINGLSSGATPEGYSEVEGKSKLLMDKNNKLHFKTAKGPLPIGLPNRFGVMIPKLDAETEKQLIAFLVDTNKADWWMHFKAFRGQWNQFGEQKRNLRSFVERVHYPRRAAAKHLNAGLSQTNELRAVVNRRTKREIRRNLETISQHLENLRDLLVTACPANRSVSSR